MSARATSGAGDGPLPELSVVVLTYNRARVLRDCLESLLAQTAAPERLEIVVADDGSSDETPDVVATYAREHARLRYVRHAHRGIPATRNLGLRHARAALVAIVADDYILDPSYAERIVRFFRDRPEASVVRFQIVPARSDLGSRISHAYYRASMLGRLAAGGGEATQLGSPPELPSESTTEHGLEASGAAAFRREVFDRVGVFDETLARAEDSDLTVRLGRAGIAVHFDPNHLVRHQYDAYLRDTIVKSWLTGWYRYHHRRKNAESQPPLRLASELLAHKTAALRAELRAERREGSSRLFWVGVPFWIVFEATNKMGYACSWLCDRALSPVERWRRRLRWS